MKMSRSLSIGAPQSARYAAIAPTARAPARRLNAPLIHAVLQRKCACRGVGPAATCANRTDEELGLRRKLAVGRSGDPLEREADRVADEALAKPVPAPTARAPVAIQRSPRSPSAPTREAPPSVERELAQAGHPLDAVTRSDMEQRFGHDFSRVRVHFGSQAAESARDVNAKAYTAGNSIVFGAGEFAPGSSTGRRLLAHELAHVVQQGAGGSAYVQRQAAAPPVQVSPGQIEAMRYLFREVTALSEGGAILAEESAAISAVVAEAEAAIVTATEIAAAGATATAIGEDALIAAGGLAADDVTGIGVADDVAIPFVLLAAAGAFALGYAVGYSASEIVTAWKKAASRVDRAVRLMKTVVLTAKTRQSARAVPTSASTATTTSSTTRVGPKCPPDVLKKLYDEVDKHCHGQKMSCTIQGDTCETAKLKISLRYSCIYARDRMQRTCWRPSDPGYEGHMQQIADLYEGLRNCEAVANVKCK